MSEFQLKRLGMLMEPEPDNPHEVGGGLNPATARGPGGELYLYPRLVGNERLWTRALHEFHLPGVF